jgi:hypothetical protein
MKSLLLKKTSIKQQSNGKVFISISIGGTEKKGEIIASGKCFAFYALINKISEQEVLQVAKKFVFRYKILLWN